MPHLRKIPYTKPVPAGATIHTRKGQRSHAGPTAAASSARPS